jgi:ketosteroid isomerase-like protein
MSDKETILAANANYYDAFEASDFAAMSGIWADDDISCIHPGWPVLVGRGAVIESYRNILSHPNQERIVHRHDTPMISGGEGRVFCVEFVGGMALAVTNWFRKIDGSWKMLHHQASPINPTVEEITPTPATRLN